MERKIILTEDGSHTVSIPEMNVTYHSIHGAIQESQHVYIEAGLKFLVSSSAPQQINIFEIGFGTGLNILLTFIEAEKRKVKIYYETVETFPLTEEEVKQLNYCQHLNRDDLQTIFQKFHSCEWGKEIQLSPSFYFKKKNSSLLNLPVRQTGFELLKHFELIYFDAFDPKVQPELWTKRFFDKIFSILSPDGILVTYSSKGDVRRAMLASGFSVEKIPGAKGKREMIRAAKKLN